jgi:uncharacterized membrane protein YbhN (UPF0104 family)
MSAKKNTKTLLAIAAIFGLCVYLYLDREDLIEKLSQLSKSAILVACLLYIIYSISASFLTRISTGLNIPLYLGIMINSLSTVAGAVLPSGATPTRFILLRKHLGLSTLDSSSSLFRTINSGLITNSFLALSLIILIRLEGSANTENHTFLTTFAFAAGIIFTLNIALIVTPLGYVSKFKRLLTILTAVKFSSYGQFINMIALSATQTVTLALVLHLYGVDLGATGTFSTYLMLATVNSLTMIIAITPGNIGIREGIYALLAPQLGFHYQDLVVISLIDRALQFLVFSAIGLISLASHNINNRKRN